MRSLIAPKLNLAVTLPESIASSVVVLPIVTTLAIPVVETLFCATGTMFAAEDEK